MDNLLFDTPTIVEPPFNYTGSKYNLLPQLLKVFDYTKSNFVDLFAGGGSVYANVVDKYQYIYINDIIKDLINMHIYTIENPTDTIIKLKNIVVDKDDDQGYLKLRDSYNAHPDPIKLYALMLCCTNNMIRFNNDFKFNQTFGRRSFNTNIEKKINQFSAHLKNYKHKLHFSTKTFFEFETPNDSFVYIDPPYSNTLAGYNCYWKPEHDTKLIDYCEILHSRNISFAVSGVAINNQKSYLIKELQKKPYIYTRNIEFNYNKVSRSGKKRFQEMLLTNYTCL